MHALVSTLRSTSPPAEMQVTTVGNSVARTGQFAVTRGLIRALRGAFPRTSFTFAEGTNVDGGFGASHLYLCGLDQPHLRHSNIIVVHYTLFVSPESEALLRNLLSMPSKPLVILVSHCSAPDWHNWPGYHVDPSRYEAARTHNRTEWTWWQKSASTSPSRPNIWAQHRRVEHSYAQHYDIPFVDTCSAMRSMAFGGRDGVGATCAPSFNSLDALAAEFAGEGTDPVHYSPNGTTLQSCILAEALLGAADEPKRGAARTGGIRSRRLPPAMGEHSPQPADFCLQAKLGSKPGGMQSAVVLAATRGWRFHRGGRGGRKQWFGANATGATMVLRTPPFARLALEIYRHHSLPMGAIQLAIDGVTAPAWIDGCCVDHCVPDAPNQGFNFKAAVEGVWPYTTHTVTITTVAKTATNCTTLGSQVNLVGIIGFGMTPNSRGHVL